jgi:anti-sigma regulatory factor (Ser/Thr protein kinase)
MKNELMIDLNIEAMNFQAAGKASSEIKKTIQKLGLSAQIIRRISIVAYELEMNLVIHGGGGKLIVTVTPLKVVINAVDEGPGIKNINKALEEGYSTADKKARELGFGAGMGLPNVKKNSNNLVINSSIGKGTNVKAVIEL